MDITPLTHHPHFIPTIIRWHWDEWGGRVPGETIETWTENLTARLNDDRIPICFVAVVDGEPVGTVELVEHDMSTHTHLSPWIASVYVHPDHRGRGIGAALVRHAEAAAAGFGVERLYLYSRSAVGLYAKLGWETLERVEYEGREVEIMMKDLGAS